MAADDVVRIERKGRKKFAFGTDGEPFEIDVVVAFYEWVDIDNKFRDEDRVIPDDQTKAYNEAAVQFATKCSITPDGGMTEPHLSTAEALDFIARLREQYEACADFFLPKLRGEQDSQDTSPDQALLFTQEAS